MMALVIWFLTLISGSVLCAATLDRKFEESISLTASVIVGVLFLTGIFGKLSVGVYLVLGIVLTGYCVSIFLLIYRKRGKNFCKRIFTPGFFLFLCFFIGGIFFNTGRLASSWDEFSHWADIVKVMTLFDDFGTNSAAESAFQSYPPAMALFQYFLQKLSFGAVEFEHTEWQLYLAYHMFIFSFLLPFTAKIEKNSVIATITFGIAVFLTPVMFYPFVYSTLYIDPVLGILSGVGLAELFLGERKDAFFSARIMAVSSMLVLMKDAGMLFAGILAFLYMITLWREEGMSIWQRMSETLLEVAAVILPKGLWSNYLERTSAEIVFSAPVDLRELWRVITSEQWDYRKITLHNYAHAMFQGRVQLGSLKIWVSYFGLAVALVFFLVLLTRGKKNRWILISGVLAQLAIYSAGLVVMYLFKFNEGEAVELASLDRYLGMTYLAVWLLVILLILDFAERRKMKEKTGMEIFLTAGLLVIVPLKTVENYVNRDSVKETRQFRSEYQELTAKIRSIVPENDRIFLISQENNGIDYWVLRYDIRPRRANGRDWSIGGPYAEEDNWSVQLSCEEFWNRLEQSYQYLALYRTNDYFYENYGELFAEDTEIENNGLYFINRETGKLEKCRGE